MAADDTCAGEVAETLDGCVAILTTVEEEGRDPRLRAVVSSLKHCVALLDAER